VSFRIDNHISEELAQGLVFHLDISREDRRWVLRNEDRDGVFCDRRGCVLCQEE